jgi:hypothetical protein
VHRFLYYTISTRLFSSALVAPLLVQIRVLIFPNNSLGPPPPPAPTLEEARRIRSKAASDILKLIPRPVARSFFAIQGRDDEEEREVIGKEIEERLLGWTEDAELNKYLIYAVLEHIILRIVPELKDKTASELLAERGVDLLEYENEVIDVSEKDSTGKVNGS